MGRGMSGGLRPAPVVAWAAVLVLAGTGCLATPVAGRTGGSRAITGRVATAADPVRTPLTSLTSLTSLAPLAAGLLRLAAAGDRAAAGELAARRAELRDPRLATAVAVQLGPQGMVEIPAALALNLMGVLADRGDLATAERSNAEVLAAAGDILAAATTPSNRPHVPAGWTARLEAEGRARHLISAPGTDQYYGYWALAQILRASGQDSPYSAAFVSTVGGDLIGWVRSSSTSPVNLAEPFALGPSSLNQPGVVDSGGGGRSSSVSGLLIGLLHAAATSPQGTRVLLAAIPPGSESSNLSYLLSRPGYWWDDAGNQLAGALATTRQP